jgi:hypothetical protein
MFQWSAWIQQCGIRRLGREECFWLTFSITRLYGADDGLIRIRDNPLIV